MTTSQNGCRFCTSPLKRTFVNLGNSPLSNSYLSFESLKKKEYYYPLHVYVCEACLLVQLEEIESPEHIFNDYAYFSSYSDSWLQHSQNFAHQAIQRLKLDSKSQVLEIASNDGYLLQYFQKAGIPVLGVEPAQNVAEVAIKKNISTHVGFFNKELADRFAAQDFSADLIVANNVLAHVPRLNDFVAGLKLLLKPRGIISIEVPHLLKLMIENQFDTIYHEHYSYFSLLVLQKLFCAHALHIFDVETLMTHGGSLRLFICHADERTYKDTERLTVQLKEERRYGLERLDVYDQFFERIQHIRIALLTLLVQLKQANKKVVGYGAPAKGNTLLNYCNITPDLLPFTVDRSPYKQGRYLPGSRIPILNPDEIRESKPDYILILPWNIKSEIMDQLAFVKDWNCKFIVAIPEVSLI